MILGDRSAGRTVGRSDGYLTPNQPNGTVFGDISPGTRTFSKVNGRK